MCTVIHPEAVGHARTGAEINFSCGIFIVVITFSFISKLNGCSSHNYLSNGDGVVANFCTDRLEKFQARRNNFSSETSRGAVSNLVASVVCDAVFKTL